MEARRPHRRWIPFVVLVVGIACTAAVYFQLARTQRARERDRLSRVAIRASSEINRRMDTYIAMLRATTGLFAASDRVTREEFARFIYRLELPSEYPGIQGIGLSVVGRDKGELEQRLHEMFEDGRVKPFPTDQPEPHAIILLEPLDELNRRAIGFNMFSHPVRRAAMEEARDHAQPAASGLVRLMQESVTSRQWGFLIYVPLYDTHAIPESVAERRRHLLGFVYAPFRVQDFFGSIVRESTLPAEFAVYDGVATEAENLVFMSPGFTEARRVSEGMYTSTSIDIARRLWTAQVIPTPELARAGRSHMSSFVGGAGVLISVLLFGLARAQARSAERFERTAAVLRESQRELLDAEARKSAILESAIDAIITMDEHGRVIEWNRAAERIFRWDGAVKGKPLDELILPRRDQRAHRQRLFGLLAAGRDRTGQRVETNATRSDGSEFPVEISICRIGVSEPPRYTGFIRDITERARAEHHRQLMTRELDHRVKNNLSTVMAILTESARRAPSIPELVRSVSGRLRALAGLHEMLAARKWKGAELHDLVARTLAPHRAAGGDGTAASGGGEGARGRVNIVGPPVTISGTIAPSLCMALHELATNASKYGSLSVAEGSVEISWRCERREGDGEWVVIVWKEENGPPVCVPAERGFGSELIEGGIAFETGGSCVIDFAPGGLVCTLNVPLRPNEEIPE